MFVEGEVDGLSHAHVVQRWMAGVEADIGDQQRIQFQHLEPCLLTKAGDVGRARVHGDLAGAGLELLHPHVGIGGDGEQQLVHSRLACPVGRVGVEADLRILTVALEDERPGADRFAVEPLGLAGLEQLVGVLGGIDGGEAHGQVGEEGRLRVSQGEAHAVVVELLDTLDQLGKGHGFHIGIAARRELVPGMCGVELALEAPEHVVGIELAAGGEPGRAVEADALAQLELVDQAVGADGPALGEARLQAGAAGSELHQAVEDGFGRGIGGGRGGVLDDVEAFRAGFGADHQCLAGEGMEGKAESEGQ
ncbi:hypothetical protein D9M71_400650 [compost metagenome]